VTHLSLEQISEWIVGEREAEVERHLQSCGKCREDIARLQDPLLAFQHSVHEWAAQPGRAVAGAITPRIPRRVSWAWPAAAAAALGIALFPLYLNVREARHEMKSAEDSLLLNQVNARLARTVPQPMEQLMELMNQGKDGLQ